LRQIAPFVLLGAFLAVPARAQQDPVSLAEAAEAAVRAAAEESVGPTPGASTVSLGEAVATALQQNFGLLDAADSVAQSRMSVTTARAEFFPKLVPTYGQSAFGRVLEVDLQQKVPWTGASISAGSLFRSSVDDAVALPRTSETRLVLSQPLLRGLGPNAAHFELRNSERGRETQERSFELTRQRTAIQVTTAFYQVILQRQLLTVARQSLKRSESLLKASEARLQVGLVSKLDVFRAELQASQAQEAMLRSETALQNALETFRGSLGLPATENVEPHSVDLPDIAVAEELEPIDVLVARGQKLRIDLAEGYSEVEDARRSLSLAKQNLLPRLDLNFSMSQLGLGTSFGSAWNTADRQFHVYLSSSYPIERGGASVDRARAELAMTGAQRGLKQRQLQIELEVRSAARELERLAKSIELQRKAVEIADQQRQLATLRYQRGLASNFDVVDAEGSLVVARSALVGLLTSHRVARYELLRATGSLDVEREFLN
jgi:outer membrane protein TolC